MRNEEQIGLILMLLDSLAAIRFSLTLNDERLNYPEGWEILKAEQTANLIRNQSAEQLHSSTSSNNSNSGSKKRKTKKRKQKLHEISIESQPENIVEETIGSYSNNNNSFTQRSSLSNNYENFKLPEVGNEKYAPISDTLIEDGIINVSESIQYMRQLYKNSNVSLAVIRQNIIKENSKNFFAEPVSSGVSPNPNLEVQVIEATTPPQKKETKQSKLIEPEETFVKIVEVPEAKVKISLSSSSKGTPQNSVPPPTPVVAEPENQVLALPEVDLEEPVIRVAGDRRIYFLEILVVEKEKAEETDWYDISIHLKKETEQKNQEKLANSRVGVPVTTSLSSFTESGPVSIFLVASSFSLSFPSPPSCINRTK